MPRPKKQENDPIFDLLSAVQKLMHDARQVALAVDRLQNARLTPVQKTHLGLIRQCLPDLPQWGELLEPASGAAAKASPSRDAGAPQAL